LYTINNSRIPLKEGTAFLFYTFIFLTTIIFIRFFLHLPRPAALSTSRRSRGSGGDGIHHPCPLREGAN